MEGLILFFRMWTLSFSQHHLLKILSFLQCVFVIIVLDVILVGWFFVLFWRVLLFSWGCFLPFFFFQESGSSGYENSRLGLLFSIGLHVCVDASTTLFFIARALLYLGIWNSNPYSILPFAQVCFGSLESSSSIWTLGWCFYISMMNTVANWLEVYWICK